MSEVVPRGASEDMTPAANATEAALNPDVDVNVGSESGHDEAAAEKWPPQLRAPSLPGGHLAIPGGHSPFIGSHVKQVYWTHFWLEASDLWEVCRYVQLTRAIDGITKEAQRSGYLRQDGHVRARVDSLARLSGEARAIKVSIIDGKRPPGAEATPGLDLDRLTDPEREQLGALLNKAGVRGALPVELVQLAVVDAILADAERGRTADAEAAARPPPEDAQEGTEQACDMPEKPPESEGPPNPSSEPSEAVCTPCEAPPTLPCPSWAPTPEQLEATGATPLTPQTKYGEPRSYTPLARPVQETWLGPERQF